MRVSYPDGPLHRPQPNEVFLEETEIEYLLFIHYKRKNLARKIPDSHWDGDRVCWVYPKTRRHFDALMERFGDELPRRPEPPSSKAVDYRTLSTEERALAKGVGDLRSVIETRAKKDAAAEHLISRLENAEADLKKAFIRINEQALENEQARAANRKLRSTIDRLEAERDAARAVAAKQPAAATELTREDEQLKAYAASATGNDPVFASLIDTMALDGRFPLVIADKLTFALRKLVGDSFAAAELFELIKEAEHRKLLSEAAVNCAHLIRMQRNLLAHPGEKGEIDERALKARVALCLFAAAIVWPELRE